MDIRDVFTIAPEDQARMRAIQASPNTDPGLRRCIQAIEALAKIQYYGK